MGNVKGLKCLKLISLKIKNIDKNITSIKEIIEKSNKDCCTPSGRIKKYIKAVSSAKICECTIIVILAVIAVCAICCCVCICKIPNSGVKDKCNLSFYKVEVEKNGTSGETVKTYVCYDPLYCFLFSLALLCVAGGLTVICVLRCSAVKKQALLTYAYDKALDKLEEVKDMDEIDGSIEIKELQNNNVLQTTKTKRKDYKKTVTKIFQAYCHNITAK